MNRSALLRLAREHLARRFGDAAWPTGGAVADNVELQLCMIEFAVAMAKQFPRPRENESLTPPCPADPAGAAN